MEITQVSVSHVSSAQPLLSRGLTDSNKRFAIHILFFFFLIYMCI